MAQIRRFVTLLGIAAIGLIGYQLVMGDMSLPDAGIRAMGVLVGVILVMRVVGSGVRLLAESLDRPSDSGVAG